MLTEEVRERLPTEEGSRTALPALVSRTGSLLGCGTLSTVTPGRAGLKAVKRGIKAAHARHPQPVSDEVTAGPVSTSRVMGSRSQWGAKGPPWWTAHSRAPRALTLG